MLYITDCLASDEQRGPPLFLEQGVVPTEIDAHCVCKAGPQMMSRPGPKSGTRSSQCSRPFDQNNTCSSWCEGGGPIRGVHRKRPTRYAVNITRAEALRRDSYKGARSPSSSVGKYTLYASQGPHVFLCAAHRPHGLPFSNLWLCTADWFSKLVLPIVRPPCF